MLGCPDDDASITVIRYFPSVSYAVEKWLLNACRGHSIGLEQFIIEAVYVGFLVILQRHDGSDDLFKLW